MSFTYPTVTIGATPYTTYLTLAAAEARINAMFGPAATAWRALSNDDKGRTIVAGTLLLDAQSWDGEKTDPDNALDFPRSGLVDEDGDDVPDDEIPEFIEQATAELAVLIGSTPALATGTTGPRVKSVEAKGVRVEFLATEQLAGGLPLSVAKLVAPYKATSSVGIAQVAGGDEESEFDTCDRFDLTSGV